MIVLICIIDGQDIEWWESKVIGTIITSITIIVSLQAAYAR